MLRLLKLRKRITLSVGRGLRVGNKGFNLAQEVKAEDEDSTFELKEEADQPFELNKEEEEDYTVQGKAEDSDGKGK